MTKEMDLDEIYDFIVASKEINNLFSLFVRNNDLFNYIKKNGWSKYFIPILEPSIKMYDLSKNESLASLTGKIWNPKQIIRAFNRVYDGDKRNLDEFTNKNWGHVLRRISSRKDYNDPFVINCFTSKRGIRKNSLIINEFNRLPSPVTLRDVVINSLNNRGNTVSKALLTNYLNARPSLKSFYKSNLDLAKKATIELYKIPREELLFLYISTKGVISKKNESKILKVMQKRCIQISNMNCLIMDRPIELNGSFFLSYEETKKIIRKLGIKSKEEYLKHLRKKPIDGIPLTPQSVYSEWTGWYDFLDKTKDFYSPQYRMDYHDLRALVIKTEIKSMRQYTKWRSELEDKRSIPSEPQNTYSEWVDWLDFLGNKKVEFVSYDEASRYMQEAGVKTKTMFEEWRKNERPSFIPSHPDRTYKKEWMGWRKFLRPWLM